MRTLASALTVTLMGVAVLFWATDGFRALTAEAARRIAVSEQPRELPHMPLQLQSGTESRLEALSGKLVVATFIYTRCTTMCPMLGVRMKHIRDDLPDRAVGSGIHFLSLSFDPKHDGPQQLTDYGQRYGADPDHWWIARPRAGLERILETFGVVVLPQDNGEFVHNGAFYLINREGRLAGIYPADAPDRVVEAVEARL